jgi:hypothetical protein
MMNLKIKTYLLFPEELCYAIVLSNFSIVGNLDNKCYVCVLNIISYLLREVMGL